MNGALLGALFLPFFSSGQELEKEAHTGKYSWKHSVAIVGIGYVGLGAIWYSNHTLESFHFFDDSREWKGQDKWGHAYTAFGLTQLSAQYHTRLNNQQHALFAFSAMAGIEVLDGFAKGWGASWSDLASNGVGAALGWLTLEKPGLGKMKFSYKSAKAMAESNPELLGKTDLEQFLKNYNGQTVWWSVPFWNTRRGGVAFSMGKGVNGFHSAHGGYHVWKLSLDFIPAPNAPWYLRFLKYVKFPFPNVQWDSQKGLYAGFY